MMTPKELKEHIDGLRAAGISGRVKIGDFEITIPPTASAASDKPTARSLKKEYDTMLFAATEGIPDEEDAS